MNSFIKCIVNSLWGRIKKEPYKYGFCLAVCVLITPIIIIVIYSFGDKGFIIINTKLSVSDALSFYGAFLAFLGTIALGIVTLIQNNRATQIAKAAFENEMRSKIPDISITADTESLSSGYMIKEEPWDYTERYFADSVINVKPSYCEGIIQHGYMAIKVECNHEQVITNFRLLKLRLNAIGQNEDIYLTPFLMEEAKLNHKNSCSTISIKICSSADDNALRSLLKNKFQLGLVFEFSNSLNLPMQIESSFVVYDKELIKLSDTRAKYVGGNGLYSKP